jgi:hypothetical protein
MSCVPWVLAGDNVVQLCTDLRVLKYKYINICTCQEGAATVIHFLSKLYSCSDLNVGRYAIYHNITSQISCTYLIVRQIFPPVYHHRIQLKNLPYLLQIFEFNYHFISVRPACNIKRNRLLTRDNLWRYI